MSGKITCYGCGKAMGTHSGEGETHGLCPKCSEQAMKEARAVAAEYRRRKGERKC